MFELFSLPRNQYRTTVMGEINLQMGVFTGNVSVQGKL